MYNILSQRALKHSVTAILKLTGSFSKPSEYYFGYGANLSSKRFSEKAMSFVELGNAKLIDYKINFSLPTEYLGKRYASVEPNKGKKVYGRLFKLSPLSLIKLDIMEWVPYRFYNREKLTVKANGEIIHNVNVYVASYPKKNLKPSKIYLNNMIKESRRLNFPDSYLDELEGGEFQEDFEIDHGFRLSHTGKRRLFEKRLHRLYQKHDKLRDLLASKLP